MIASIVKTINLRALTATFDLTCRFSPPWITDTLRLIPPDEMGILAIWWTYVICLLE